MGRILLFQGWFRIRMSCPNHLGTLIIPIKYLKCLKNSKNACAEWGYYAETRNPSDGLTVSSLRWQPQAAFLIHFKFLMGIIKVPRWFGDKILILKHPWKSKIRPMEQILGWNRYQTFLFMHPVQHIQIITFLTFAKKMHLSSLELPPVSNLYETNPGDANLHPLGKEFRSGNI